MAEQGGQKVKLTPAQAMEKAHEHYAGGRLENAARILEAILAARPRDADALNLAAATALARGLPNDAVALMGVRRRMIWNSGADFGSEGAGSSSSCYAAWR